MLQAGIETCFTLRQADDIPLGLAHGSVINTYVSSLVCLFCAIGYQSAQFVRSALHYASGNRYIPLPECSTPVSGSVYIYIYIYMCVCVCVEREREKERKKEVNKKEREGVINAGNSPFKTGIGRETK